MKSTAVLIVAVCSFFAAPIVFAQSSDAVPATPAPGADSVSAQDAVPTQPDFLEKISPPGVSLGFGVLASDGILVGESVRTYLAPTVAYEGDRLFVRGISGGVHLVKHDGFEFNALLSLRLDGWDANDLSASGLAAVGINRSLLRDRFNEIDGGLGVSWRGKAGQLGLTAQGDLTNKSGGYDVALTYRAAFEFAGGAVVPSLGVSYWSADLTDYYYGTLPQEVAAGVPSYQPGSAIVPNLGVAYLRALSPKWLLVAGLNVNWLNDDILDSPLVASGTSHGVPSVFFALSYSFGKIH